jgi:hypothetical protein
LHLKFLRSKEALGRPKLRWEKNIDLYVKEMPVPVAARSKV